MALTISGLVHEYVAKLATGTGPGVNAGPTTTWVDNVGTNDVTLRNTAGNFGWTTSSGWAGSGTAADPYRLVCDGTGDYGTFAATPSPISTAGYGGAFSVELWTFNTADPAASGWYFRDRVTANTGVYAYLNSADDKLTWSIGNGSAPLYPTENVGLTGFDASPLHHLLTYDGTTVTPYRNGSAQTSARAFGFQPNNDATTLCHTSTAGTAVICTVRFYSICLTPTQAAANYAAGVLAASTDTSFLSGIMRHHIIGRGVRLNG